MAQLDPVVLDALNRQITTERFNAAIYMALANRLDSLNLTGFGAWMRAASTDETMHAQKFTDYIIDRNAFPIVAPLDGFAPPNGDMMTIGTLSFAAALQRELTTTDAIKMLYDLADEIHDSQTCQFLLWFLDEQTKSVRETTELTARAQFAQGDSAAILAMDHELGEGEK